jgi:hypothetical protein
MKRMNSFRVGRILAVLSVIIMATACDGDTPSPPTSRIVLPDGDYVLTISLGILPPIGGSPTFCMISPGPQVTTAGFPIRVTGSGQSWTVRMPQPSGPGGGSLEMTFSAADTAVTGTIAGNARSADDAVALTIPSATSFSGTERSPSTLGGQIAGDVRLESGQSGLTCRGSVWTLAPR